MARPKIRYRNGIAYRLRPGETLEQAIERSNSYNLGPDEIIGVLGPVKLSERSIRWVKPRVGKGSGRAGGARGATHAVDHRKLVHPGTTVDDCPACKYGAKLWRLWNETVKFKGSSRVAVPDGFEPGSWESCWESNYDEERLQCEQYFEHYEWEYTVRREDKVDPTDESDFYEQREQPAARGVLVARPRFQAELSDVAI